MSQTQREIDMLAGRVWIWWCASGCEPSLFSTEEKAEAFRKTMMNGHGDVDVVIIDKDVAAVVEGKKG